MKSEQIHHQGTIETIKGNKVRVKIQNVSACAGCHAKGACNSADSSDKFVDVTITQNQSFNIGQIVELVGNYSMGLKAALYAYILPFIIVLISLIIALSIFNNELIGGLIALGVLVPYYLTLYFTIQKFEKTFVFTIQN